MVNQALNNRIRDYRLRSGLTGKEVSKALGISRNHLYRCENKIHIFSENSLAILANLYEVDKNELIKAYEGGG